MSQLYRIKMSQFYRIKGLPGLEGLVVDTNIRLWEAREAASAQGTTFCAIDALINPDAILGDRTVKFPMPKGKLLIDLECLEQVADPNKEFSAKSPFGVFQFEGQLKRGKLVVDYARYDNAITITIREDHGKVGRTVYTQNFFGDYVAGALDRIEHVLSGEEDVEELVFQLKDLKDVELQARSLDLKEIA